MQTIKNILKAHPVLSFFILTYLISWLIWAPMIAGYLRDPPAQLTWDFLWPALAGVYGPTIAALLVTAAIEGRAGLKSLLSVYRIWRVGLRWYLLIFLVYPILYALGMLLYLLVSGDQPDFHPGVLRNIPLVFLLAIPLGPLGEELGWRGFALPRLQKTHGAVTASLVIGIVWFGWHLPSMFVPGTALPAIEIGWDVLLHYALTLLALSFLFAYFYNHAGGSVLITILLHAAVNSTPQIITPLFLGRLSAERTMPVLWSIAVVLWLFTAGLVLFSKVFHRPSQAVTAGPDPV